LSSILHVSDVHFGPKHLPRLSAAVADLVGRSRPTVVVVSGDLTQRARPRQFREARAWIEALGRPVVWIPGNHDVPMYRVWERVLSPFGAWRRHFAPQLVRDEAGEELAVYGLNTAYNWTIKHGRVTAADLADLERRVAAAPAGAARVVAAHHPLEASPQLGDEPPARGGAAAMAALEDLGVELVLSGHLHRSFWIGPATAGRAPLVLHVGTTTSSRGRGPERGRSSLHWIEIDAGTIAVERRLWNPPAGRFEPEARRLFPRRRGSADG